MRLSLKIKVSGVVALVAVLVGALTAYIFIAASLHAMEKKQLARGEALIHSLTRAVTEGLIIEDIDLIKRAESIVQAEDVELVQVYSTIWDAIDAYPFEKLRDKPDSDAIIHFKDSDTPFFKKIDSLYNFYSPIYFSLTDASTKIIIGYVRLNLSSSAIQQELKKTVFNSIIISAVITLIIIATLNFIINRLVINPVIRLRKSVQTFESGKLPAVIPVGSTDEIAELIKAFNQMAETIDKDTHMIKKAEEKFSKAFSSSPTLMSISTLREGRFIEVNEAFLNASGHTKEEFMSRTALELGIWAEPADRAEIVRQLQEKGIVYGVETRIRKKNGDVLTVLLSAELIEIEMEQCILAVMLDISERKNLEDQLRQAQKMEAVGQLAGGIAHDFNNILTAIVGYANIVKMKLSSSDPLKDHLDQILASSKRGARLTQSLLTFSRQQTGSPAPVDINEIVKEVESLLISIIGEKIKINTNLNSSSRNRDERGESRKLLVKADRVQIDQVLINLCTNARDAMPDGGVLTIETRLLEMDNEFIAVHGFGIPGSYARISVSDTGSGIDDKVIKRMFDPFFTTKEVGKGTGLGLSIVYGIIKGFVDCYSESDKGSTFNIYLPLIE